MTEPRRLRVFLCHASEDNSIVGEINDKLESLPWVDPWLDEEDLLPGQEFEPMIELALRQADVVLICLSTRSVNKEGYVQKEVARALSYAEEKPEDTIYLVPLLLDECEPPFKLKKLHWAKYSSEAGFERILDALKVRAASLGIDVNAVPVANGKPKRVSKQPKRTGFRSVVKMFLGIMLPIFGCAILAAAAISRKYFEGIWIAGTNEVIFTIVAFFALLVLSFVMFVDAVAKLTVSGMQGINQRTSPMPGTTIKPVIFTKDFWLQRIEFVRNGLYDKDVFQRRFQTVRESVATLRTRENWLEPEFKDRVKAAVWSLFIPGLGLYFRGRNTLALISLIATTLGYIADFLPGILLHLLVIVLSGVLDKPEDDPGKAK